MECKCGLFSLKENPKEWAGGVMTNDDDNDKAYFGTHIDKLVTGRIGEEYWKIHWYIWLGDKIGVEVRFCFMCGSDLSLLSGATPIQQHHE